MAMGFSLHTDRLTLRDYRLFDYSLVREVFLHPQMAAFHLSGQDSEAYVAEHHTYGLIQNRWQPRLAYDLAIISANGEALGLCGLKQRLQPQPMRGQQLECGNLNWHILPAHWHCGYATEAAARLLEFGFAELQLPVIEASAFADNAASLRVMEKIGLRPANNNATAQWWRGLTYGERRPIVRYALSKAEWLAERLQAATNQPFVLLKAA
jgi:[ribosomal protein S5]-alanine N-acetyltransferase